MLSGTYWGETIIDGDTLYDNISANAFLLRTNASFYTIGSFTTDCTTCYAGQVEKGDDGNIVFRVNMSGLLYFFGFYTLGEQLDLINCIECWTDLQQCIPTVPPECRIRKI